MSSVHTSMPFSSAYVKAMRTLSLDTTPSYLVSGQDRKSVLVSYGRDTYLFYFTFLYTNDFHADVIPFLFYISE